jgi:hypothetical protein
MRTYPSTSTALCFAAFFGALLGRRSSFKAGADSSSFFFFAGSF